MPHAFELFCVYGNKDNDAYNVSLNGGEKQIIVGVDVVYTYIKRFVDGIGKKERVRGYFRRIYTDLCLKSGVLRMLSAEFECELDIADRKISEMIAKNIDPLNAATR